MGNCLKCFQATEHSPATLDIGAATATSSSIQSLGHITHLTHGRYSGISLNINANENHQQNFSLQHHQMHTGRGGTLYKERSHGKLKSNLNKKKITTHSTVRYEFLSH